MKTVNTIRLVLIGMTVLALAVPAWGQTNPSPELRYAQVANGLLSANSFYVTTLFVSNPDTMDATAAVDSFDEANPSNSMNLGFQTTCALDPTGTEFTIPANAACSFVSDGGGGTPPNPEPNLKTGWLRVVTTSTGSDGNPSLVGGYLAYTLYQGDYSNAFPIFTAGVSPTPIMTQFTLPVIRDSSSFQDMGFAIANPFGDGPTDMQAQLFDTSGNVVDSADINLPTEGHIHEFLSTLFPKTLGGNVSNFVGNMVVTGATTNDAAIATGVIQQGAQYGGAPPTSVALYPVQKAQSRQLARREANQAPRQHEQLRPVTKLSKF